LHVIAGFTDNEANEANTPASRHSCVISWSMGDAEILEVLARGAAAGVFLGLAIVIGRGSYLPARVTGVLFCLAAAAHTLTQLSTIELALGWAWPSLWALSVMGAGFFWAFATELFEDRRRLEARRFAPAVGLLALGLVAAMAPPAASRILWLAHNLLGAALMAHVLFVITTGWRDDLVETRRRLRGPILAAAALYALSVIAVQILELLWRPADVLSPLAAAALLTLGLAAIGALLQADPDLFAAMQRPAEASPPSMPAASGDDVKIAAKLDRLMRVERAFREEDLSIAALALRVGVPEYKLRRLINRQLGHRNFNAYLNQWRLAEVTQALADPDQRDVPISTIALDAGFQSLGPFNRAFKAETGLTPTAFRAQALAGAKSDPSAAAKAT
jgi:AraC-like DNA-binding protein